MSAQQSTNESACDLKLLQHEWPHARHRKLTCTLLQTSQANYGWNFESNILHTAAWQAAENTKMQAQSSQAPGEERGLTSSERGSTRGARAATLVFKARPAEATTLRCSRMPRLPSSSSSWRMALKASSSAADVAAHRVDQLVLGPGRGHQPCSTVQCRSHHGDVCNAACVQLMDRLCICKQSMLWSVAD